MLKTVPHNLEEYLVANLEALWGPNGVPTIPPQRAQSGAVAARAERGPNARLEQLDYHSSPRERLNKGLAHGEME